MRTASEPAFAAAVGVTRPAAYARLARLRTILGADLDRPRTRLSLHLAMLAIQQQRDTAGAPADQAEKTSRPPT